MIRRSSFFGLGRALLLVFLTVVAGASIAAETAPDAGAPAKAMRKLVIQHTGSATGATFPTPGTYYYTEGSSVAITSGTSFGVYFGGWEGDADGFSEVIMVPMTSDKTIIARFENSGYTLTLHTQGQGDTTPGPLGNPHRFVADATIYVQAFSTDTECCRFSHWVGDIDDWEPKYYILTVKMTRSRDITAVFIVRPMYTLTLNVVGGGTTDPVPGIYSHKEWTYIRGQAIDAPGWVFDHWEGDFGDMLATYPRFAVSMDKDRVITAYFVQVPEGEGSAEGEGTAEGEGEGITEGEGEGITEGEGEGITEGEGEGITEGEGEGITEGQGEGITEGEGEGQDTGCALSGGCPFFTGLGISFCIHFSTPEITLNWTTCDLDNSGMPDSWEMALFEEVLCRNTEAFGEALRCLFKDNLALFRAEPIYRQWYGLEMFFVAYLTMNSSTQLAASELGLSNTYQVFKSENSSEPFSINGDPDGDGIPNFEEYQNTVSAGLNKSAYVQAALTPYIPEGEGAVEGEGDGTPDGAVEGEGDGTPDGAVEGEGDGTPDGAVEGEGDGTPDGAVEGEGDGTPDGAVEGEGDGTPDGAVEGEGDGTPDGAVEGEGDGTPDGEREGSSVLPYHTADQNSDSHINLTELLRVVQFFNYRGFECAVPPVVTEDGYVPGSGAAHSCTPHASDYNAQNWQISLSELLRLIQFFNMRGYYACPEMNTEDGYCPGIAP